MEILSKNLGTRPRLAVEIRGGGIVAARSEPTSASSDGLLAAVSRVDLEPDALEPGLKAGNFRTRAAVAAAVRRALEAVTEKGLGRVVTLIVPDAAVRVLLLDFDTLPAKPAEALPVVRFRLKKMLPFDADDAQLSYQTMSAAHGASSKGLVRVVAVAIPRLVLEEYESVVREAGFEPGAVLPSTLATLAGLAEQEAPALVVNAGPQSVTTAIVQDGVILLHRSVDMSGNVQVGILAEAAAAQPAAQPAAVPALPLVDREASQQEWAMQQAVPQHGRDPYGVTGRESTYDNERDSSYGSELAAVIAAEAIAEANETAQEDKDSAAHADQAAAAMRSHMREITQAVSVAAAYFEDTLAQPPSVILSAGSTSAVTLHEMLAEAGFGVIAGGAHAATVHVEEMVEQEALVAQAATARVPRSWLAGVRGALRS
jgi:type IV pilus assembly protein PilM